MRIGVDLMGGDLQPEVLFEGVMQAATSLGASCQLIVIATHSVVNVLRQKPLLDNIIFHAVSDSIAMTDEPVQAVRRKKESSLVVGIHLLKKKRLDGFISIGNTGALLASAALNLPKLPGVQRPALLVALPTVTGSVAVIDVGGNVLCKAHHLIQFAQMGAAYQTCSEGIDKPKVGLLNIGVEAQKGTSIVRQAYQSLQNHCLTHPESSKMSFIGNVEGRDVFQGKVDVLVTDGFTGNVLLKTSEGLSSFIFEYIHESLSTEGPLHQAFQELKRYFSYSEYPGAILCGIEGIVIKCHGHSSPNAIYSGIKGAAHLIQQELISKIKLRLQEYQSG